MLFQNSIINTFNTFTQIFLIILHQKQIVKSFELKFISIAILNHQFLLIFMVLIK